MLPFTLDAGVSFEAEPGDWVYVPEVSAKIKSGAEEFPARLIAGGKVTGITLHIAALTPEERDIILAGCLMNYYADKLK